MKARINWRTLFIDGLIALVVASAIAATSGIGHSGSSFYRYRWIDENEVGWRFKQNFPGGNWRTRVEQGTFKWNRLPPSFHYDLRGEASGFSYKDCPIPRTSAMHYGFIDGDPTSGFDTYGRTRWCNVLNDLESVQVKFDSGNSWWTKDSTSGIPSGKVDAESVAVHEFGHFGGWVGHFDGDDEICQPGGANPKQTMCQGLPQGQAFWRTLETHDKHTFDSAY